MGLAELWQPLKAAEIPGQKWRDRDTGLRQLLAGFQVVGVEESLLAGIQVVLKMKVETRGEFALATVIAAEKAYTAYICAQKEAIDAFGSTDSVRGAAAAEAEAGVKIAQEALDASSKRAPTRRMHGQG